MPEMPTKVEENRVRRIAARQNLRLEKSRRRDPLSTGYATFRLRHPDGHLVAGDEGPYDYGLTLEQIEAWLTGERGGSR